MKASSKLGAVCYAVLFSTVLTPGVVFGQQSMYKPQQSNLSFGRIDSAGIIESQPLPLEPLFSAKYVAVYAPTADSRALVDSLAISSHEMDADTVAAMIPIDNLAQLEASRLPYREILPPGLTETDILRSQADAVRETPSPTPTSLLSPTVCPDVTFYPDDWSYIWDIQGDWLMPGRCGSHGVELSESFWTSGLIKYRVDLLADACAQALTSNVVLKYCSHDDCTLCLNGPFFIVRNTGSGSYDYYLIESDAGCFAITMNKDVYVYPSGNLYFGFDTVPDNDFCVKGYSNYKFVIERCYSEYPSACYVSRSYLSFPDTKVGQSNWQEFYVRNNGCGTLSGSVSESSQHFRISPTSGYSLGAGESKTYRVYFEPQSCGYKSTTIYTGSGCSNVSADGTAWDDPDCYVSRSSLSFPDTKVGQWSSESFYIRNDGCGTLSGSVSESSSHFWISPTSGYSLGAGESKNYTVYFQPQSCGYKSTTISTGTGCINPTAYGTAWDDPVCYVSRTSADFGSVDIGQSRQETFFIRNDGCGTLSGTLSEVCPDFSVTPGSYNLGAGQSQTFTVTFAPQSCGDKNCTINLGDGCGIFTCAGRGTLPATCWVSPTSLAFPVTQVGQCNSMTFQVRNDGCETLVGNIVACSGFSVNPPSINLGPGQSTTVTVQFCPTACMHYSCTIQIPGGCTVQVSGDGEVDGWISATSNPSGATVYLDGQPKGVTPTTFSASPGSHSVTFTKTCYYDCTKPVSVICDETTPVDCQLTELPGPAAPNTPTVSPNPVCVDVQYCVSWNEVSGATSYEIQENGGEWEPIGNDTQRCYAKSSPGDYTYRVRAVDDCWPGDPSGEQTVTVVVLPGAPGTPWASPNPVCVNVQYCVSWNDVSGAVSYEIQENGGDWLPVAGGTQQCYTKSLSGDYIYRVRAVNACGPGNPSGELTVVVVDIPGTPDTPSASPNPVCVNVQYCLSWNQVSSATSYEIQENGGEWEPIGNDTQRCYAKSSPGDYTYRVQAVNACGPGDPSGEQTVTVDDVPGAPDTPLASPNPACINQQYCLSWNEVSGATSYEIQEDGGDWLPVAGGTQQCYTKSLSGSYTYRVRAMGDCGPSDPSGQQTVTVNPGTPDTPSASPNPVCVNVQYCVSWNQVPGAISYEIQENGGDWLPVASGTQQCYTKSLPGSYTYRVRAVDACGPGNPSGEETVTVNDIPGAPDTPLASPNPVCVDVQYCVSWNEVPDAVSYEIQENGGDWLPVAGGTQQCYTKSLSGSHTYCVRAVNACGPGNSSGEQTVVVVDILAAPNTPWVSPDAPCAYEEYCLNWDPVSGATSYEIQENGGSWLPVTGGTQQCYTKDLSGSYTYRVRAVNACGPSDPSGELTVVVDDCVQYPQIAVDPLSLYFTVPTNGSDSAVVQISNVAAQGALDLTWEISHQGVILALGDAGIRDDTNARRDLAREPRVGPQQKAASQMSSVDIRESVALSYTPGLGWQGHSQGFAAVLYDQTDFISTSGITSQNFEAINDAYDNQGADDFVIPAVDGSWTIESVEVLGLYSDGGGPATSVNVWFYVDAGGLPGAEMFGALNVVPTAGLADGSFSIELNPPAVLPEGTCWVSVQANQDFDPFGQWYWRERTVQSYAPSAWRNPGDGFGHGCISWTERLANCGVGQYADLLFRLNGSTGSTGCTWLSVRPSNGVVPPEDYDSVVVHVDATGLAPGTYDCELTITSNDPDPGDNPIIVPVTLQVYPILNAEFTADSQHGCEPLTVLFTDQSTGGPTSWSWFFGDGDTSNQQNPTHEYESTGIYTVSLTVSNVADSDTVTKSDYITVNDCDPQISVDPLTLSFTVETNDSDSDTIRIRNVAAQGAYDLTWGISHQGMILALNGGGVRDNTDVRSDLVGEPRVEPQQKTASQMNSVDIRESMACPNAPAPKWQGHLGGFTAVLYDQTDFDTTYGITSQNFEVIYDAYDNQAADDFVIPAEDESWIIESVDVSGFYSEDGGPATSVNVWFYVDAGGLPGAEMFGALNVIPAVGLADGSFSLELNPPAVLSEGTYWVSVQSNQDIDPFGQWYWKERTVQSFAPSAWRNPGDGFGHGCISWTERVANCGVGQYVDLIFRLNGSIGSTECSWLSTNPSNGVVPAEGYDDVVILVDATGVVAGTYNCELIITSNDPDPDDNPIIVPVSLQVIDCDCDWWGDVTGDTGPPPQINPLDVTFMVQYVYYQNDMRTQHPNCPYEAGDSNCDGQVNPLDVTFYVQFVYFQNNMFCPDPCTQ